MSSSKIPHQNDFLYEGVFTCAMEKSLLHSLLEQKFTNEWKSSEITDDAWNVARVAVNEEHHCHVTLLDALSRKRFLQARYKTFTKLCKANGVQYDPIGNVVYAEDAVWRKLFKENSLYQAYRHVGEPEYSTLSVLFGEDAVKIEFSHTVINISSSLPPPSYLGPTLLLSEEDEVTSPIFKATRRKLFTTEKETNSDQISTTDGDHRYAYVKPKTDEKQPTHDVSTRARPKFGGSSSSCASNSPVTHYCFGPFKG